MKILKEWIFKPLILALLFPFLLVFFFLGFIQCWQCHKVLHFFKSKKYHLISFGSERVCKDCYDLLTTRKL
jgi:hypothetical protein